MKKLFLITAFMYLSVATATAQVNFFLQADGSFINLDNNKPYAVIKCPGMSQQELYYNFLVTLQNKCVISNGQYAVVPDKSINVFSYESQFKVGSIWSMQFKGYLYYKFMFQFRDGQVRVEAPIVDHLGDPNSKAESYWKFSQVVEMAGLFEKDGTIREKRREQVEKLSLDITMVLNYLINASLANPVW